MAAFEELGVMPEIIEALSREEWHLPRPVQTEAIPLILGGGDVAVAAETGAGKTGAFCVPILQTVFETLHEPKRTVNADLETVCHLSTVDRSRSMAVEGVYAQSRHAAAWNGVRASRGVAQGKWYFVVRPDDEGLCRCGWSGPGANLNLGTDKHGFGYGGTGKKSHGSRFDDYGKKYGKGDAVTCLLEFNDEKQAVCVSYLHNEDPLGAAFEDMPYANIPSGGLFPTIALKNAQVKVDFQEISARAEEMGFSRIGVATAADAEPGPVLASAQKCTNVSKDTTEEHKPTEQRKPLTLILEPSRELAAQVDSEIHRFASALENDPVRHILLTGGGNPKQEVIHLKAGMDIVTGTLGVVSRHIEKGTLSLENIRFFVLDEADTFATDNLAAILRIHEAIPPRNQVQTLLFSATLHSPEIRNLAEKIQRFPTWIDLKGKEAVPTTVHHTLVRLDADVDSTLASELAKSLGYDEDSFPWPLDSVHGLGEDAVNDAADLRSLAMKRIKLAALKRVIDANEMNHAMLFARTQLDCDNLEAFLLLCSGVSPDAVEKNRFRGSRESGPQLQYSCAVLHGGRRAEERTKALQAFRNSEVRFLVCTDVAARGIDITGLPFLVNVTLPDKSENYIHRVGRVGRSDYMGLAVSLVSSQKEAVWYHTCSKPKGGTCKKRKLVSLGGCVLWYSEPKLLEEIEERLQGSIEVLNSAFVREAGADAAPVLYGSMRDEATLDAETQMHIELLKPTVRELGRLEHAVQQSFYALQKQYLSNV